VGGREVQACQRQELSDAIKHNAGLDRPSALFPSLDAIEPDACFDLFRGQNL
jgi:hypothetical protein